MKHSKKVILGIATVILITLLYISTDLNAQGLVPGAGANRRVFTEGTNSFTVPANVTTIYFEACSAGGGKGGRFYNGTDYRTGGGGGGGGFYRGYLTVTVGQVLSIVCGAPGTNGKDGTSTTAPATMGNGGGPTTISLAGGLMFSLTGGNGGTSGTSTTMGNGGMAGGVVNMDAAKCTTTESGTGIGGMPGVTTPVPMEEYSGPGGTVGRMGSFNYLAQFMHYVEPASNGTFVYYLAPYYGNGAGRGSFATGGYVYLYW